VIVIYVLFIILIKTQTNIGVSFCTNRSVRVSLNKIWDKSETEPNLVGF